MRGLIVGIWTEPESETLRNLLWSTFAIAIGSTLASLVVLERARKGISLAHERALTVTLALVALATAVAVVAIWAQPSEDTLGKIGGSGYVAAAACALAALLTLARLAQRHRWVLDVTLGLLALGARGSSSWGSGSRRGFRSDGRSGSFSSPSLRSR